MSQVASYGLNLLRNGRDQLPEESFVPVTTYLLMYAKKTFQLVNVHSMLWKLPVVAPSKILANKEGERSSD